MARVGTSGEICWPLKTIGLTVMVGVAALLRSTMPALMTLVVIGLIEEPVMLPLARVRMPPVVERFGAVVPPLLLKLRLEKVLLPARVSTPAPLTETACDGMTPSAV